jgi:hypothetical protein
MAVLGVMVGLAVIALVLWDGFEAMVLPRRVMRTIRPARLFYRTTWVLWGAIARAVVPRAFRDTWLSYFGPLSLLALIAVWVAWLMIGFALVNWSLDTIPPADGVTFLHYLYMSGTTFTTLGYGDFTPGTSVGRVLAVSEAGVGFGFLAVVIGYLPVVFQAFAQREVTIALLDARAGSPPSAAEVLLRLTHAHSLLAVNPLLGEWERWAAQLLESHLSFPVLSYYRSQHDNQSWVSALAMMLDTSALLMASVKGADRYQAQLTFAVARHAAVDLAMIFRTAPGPLTADRLPPERLLLLHKALQERGAELYDAQAAAARLTELRGMYEPFVSALADYFLLALPPIWPEKPPVDNWQTSAWMKRIPGFGQLPTRDADDGHFA